MRFKTNFNNAPILHDSQLGNRYQRLIEADIKFQNSFQSDPRLSIYLAHNYDHQSLLERNLNYLGIKDYKCLNLPLKPWSHVLRLRFFVKWLETCKTEYVLHCDADDVVFTKSPKEILDLFFKFNAKLVYGSTDFSRGYQCMPDQFSWAESKHPARYINAGVFIGKTQFVLQFYKNVLNYVSDTPSSAKDFYEDELRFKEKFPYGIGCDQPIVRFLEPEFYPDIKLDADNNFVFRNNNKTKFEVIYLKYGKLLKGLFKK
jgi:hypothetical protein